MQHRISLPDLLEVGVVGGKAVVRAGAAGIQQTHRITLVTEGGLHADEHVAEVAAEGKKRANTAAEDYADKNPEQAEKVKKAVDDVKDKAAELKEKGDGVIEQVTDAVKDAKEKAAELKQKGDGAIEQATEAAEDAKERAADRAGDGGANARG